VLWARVLRRTNSTERIIRLEGRLYSVLIVQNALHCLDTGGFWLAYELKENVVMILLLFVFEIAGNGTRQLCIVFPFPTQDSMPANIFQGLETAAIPLLSTRVFLPWRKYSDWYEP